MVSLYVYALLNKYVGVDDLVKIRVNNRDNKISTVNHSRGH